MRILCRAIISEIFPADRISCVMTQSRLRLGRVVLDLEHRAGSRAAAPRRQTALPALVGSAVALLLFVSAGTAAAQFEAQVADFGTCELESGEVIQDCTIGYRTAGTLSADGSNAVLFPSWYGGSSGSLESYIGPGGYADSTRYFVIAVDAFGSGGSSAPSTSTSQPGAAFPRYTIGDMVASQRRLLDEVFELEHLHAVVGISMGGMQVFEWLTTYPDMVDKGVSIVGTPWMSAWDLMLWTHVIRTMEQCIETECDDMSSRFGLIADLLTRTPQYQQREVTPEEFEASLQEEGSGRPFSIYDRLGQTWAMRMHDVRTDFGGSAEEAARTIQAELLVAIATYDHWVAPDAARDFAALVDGELYETSSYCGHQSFGCMQEAISVVVSDFLARPVRERQPVVGTDD
jgi:homoserine O-acetyltransferase